MAHYVEVQSGTAAFNLLLDIQRAKATSQIPVVARQDIP